VLATQRLLLSFDRAFTPNITIGARVGYAFGGGPPAGAGPDDQNRGGGGPKATDPVAGTKFLPFHLEFRGTYWIGKGALGKKGLRPYVVVGGGLAQVDAKVKVNVADCPAALSDADYNNCVAGDKSFDTSKTRAYSLDAWRKMGQGFITVGGGAMWAFNPRFGAVLNINLMYMLPTSGPVIQPSIGLEYGL
jgi:hypothetical protein